MKVAVQPAHLCLLWVSMPLCRWLLLQCCWQLGLHPATLLLLVLQALRRCLLNLTGVWLGAAVHPRVWVREMVTALHVLF